jgi:acetolactate synthase-1/2/3 large subunit
MTQEVETCRVADWVVRRIADEGIEHIFLLPGGGAMHLNDAITLEPRVMGVICQHEQACGIAAEAYGRTGSPSNPGFGVAMVTSGPGATNAITPVVGAWIDSIPMLVISGQAKRADLVGNRGIRQGGVQEVDIVKIVSSITKYAVTVMDPVLIEEHLQTALRLMRSGRPGPVWIDIPLDVQAAPLRIIELRSSPMKLGNSPSEPIFARPSQAQTEIIELVLRLLTTAQRPLVLAGHGVRLSGAAQLFKDVIEKLGLPTVTTWNALDLLPYDHPLNIGRPGVVATRAANFAVQNCDLLIVIGARLDNVVTGYNLAGFARSAKKVYVDVDLAEIKDKSFANLDVTIQMEGKEFLEKLGSRAQPIASRSWRERCLDWKTRYTQNEGKVFPNDGPISHAYFVDALSEAVPEDTLIATGSSGLAIEFFYAGFRNKPGQRMYLTSGLGSMGYGLPAAIGACLGNGSQPIVAVESDGSLQLNLQELATVSSLCLPICMIVMNNGGYSSIKNTQRNYFNERYIGTSADSGLMIPNLQKLAEVYGLAYSEITDARDLAAQLSNVLTLDRPILVDVKLIPDESLSPKCSALPQSDGSMLSMPLEDMAPLLSIEQLRAEMIVPLTLASIQARDAKRSHP